MDNLFIVAGVISVIFFIIKFLEMRHIDKEPKPLKILIRDTILVYVSVLFGDFIVEQVSPNIEDIIIPSAPIVFTDNPAF